MFKQLVRFILRIVHGIRPHHCGHVSDKCIRGRTRISQVLHTFLLSIILYMSFVNESIYKSPLILICIFFSPISSVDAVRSRALRWGTMRSAARATRTERSAALRVLRKPLHSENEFQSYVYTYVIIVVDEESVGISRTKWIPGSFRMHTGEQSDESSRYTQPSSAWKCSIRDCPAMLGCNL